MNRDTRLAHVVETLYAAAVHPADWPRFLELMNRTFDADVAAFAHYDTRRQEHAVNVCVGLSPSEVRSYEEHFSSRNVWVDRGGEQLVAGVVVGEQLCPQPDLKRSEYYNDFLRKRGVGHVVGAAIRGNKEEFTGLSILRSERRGTFSRQEVTWLEHVLPHLKRAVQIHERIASAELAGQPLSSVADTLSEGLIILDGQARALLVNRAARAILDRNDVLELTTNGLRLRTQAQDAELRRLLRSAMDPPRLGASGGGGVLAVPRSPPRRPLLLLVTPGASEAAGLDRGHASALVWLRDPETVQASKADWMRLAFGLSPAEARLVGLLRGGATLNAAAEGLGISVHTARCQLKAALTKTGTHRQAELVRLTRADPGLEGPLEAEPWAHVP